MRSPSWSRLPTSLCLPPPLRRFQRRRRLSPLVSRPAPVAEPPVPRVLPLARSKRKAFSPADLAVVVAALCIVALSVAGLYWLLRG
jgi:hypothetical protein